MAMYLSGAGLRQIFCYLLGGFDERLVGAPGRRAPARRSSAVGLIVLRARTLDGLLLGEETAAHLGIDVRRERRILLGAGVAGHRRGGRDQRADRLRRAGRATRRPAAGRPLGAPGPAALRARWGASCSPTPTSRRGSSATSPSASSRPSSAPRSSSSCCGGPARATSCDARSSSHGRCRSRPTGDRAVLRDDRRSRSSPASGWRWSARTARASRPSCGSLAGCWRRGRPGRAGGRPVADARPDGRRPPTRRRAAASRACRSRCRGRGVVGLGRLPHEDPFRGARPADQAAVAAAIERVGVGHLLGRDARELSLGERQLVLIALALAQAAPILVLDEPTVHLDLRHQVSTWSCSST